MLLYRSKQGNKKERKNRTMKENKEMENKYIFTEDQQETVCRHFGKEKNDLEFWEICELLDRIIDNLD